MVVVVQGFQGMWCIGEYVYCNIVKEGLGVFVDNEIVGFLYLGMLVQDVGFKLEFELEDYFIVFV